MKTNVLASIIKSNVITDNKPKFYMCDITFVMNNNDLVIISPTTNPFFQTPVFGENPTFNYDVFFMDGTNYGNPELQKNQYLAGDEILPKLAELKEEDVIVVLKNRQYIRFISLSDIKEIIVQRPD